MRPAQSRSRHTRPRNGSGREPEWPSIPNTHAVDAVLVARRAAKCIGQNNDAGTSARVIKSGSAKFSSARAARTCAWTTTAASTTALGARTGAEYRLRLHRQQAFALQLLAGELARAAHGLGLFTGLFLGRLFVVAAELHLAENTLALHLLLQRLEGLVDIVIAN